MSLEITKAFSDLDEAREEYKQDLNKIILDERNSYRDKIEARKDKETVLLSMIKTDTGAEAMPKADINALKAAITAAEEMMVKPKYVKKGKKYLEFM